MSEQIKRVQASLYSLFIGDALSMPVHWYYRVSDIYRQFPPMGITKMEAAPAQHPSSIMSLHSTSTGGRRGSALARLEPEIVGEIILKGKQHLWNKPGVHYHHGLQAGDNTLNACCARLMVRHLGAHGRYDKDKWLDEYIAFMTAEPAQHPDTYAESYHRGFFANLNKGAQREQCGAITHDTASMGALVTVAPLALSLFTTHDLDEATSVCCEHVRLTHPDAGLIKVVSMYVALIYQIMHERSETELSELFVQASEVIPNARLHALMQKRKSDADIVGGVFSTACYITDSWPSVCYLCAKYHTTPAKALLVNTNLGGENAHRGSVLGSLVGLAHGEFDVGFFTQLVHQESIMQEVETFVERFY